MISGYFSGAPEEFRRKSPRPLVPGKIGFKNRGMTRHNPRQAAAALPRIAMISTHGYVAAKPPLGAADTGGQVV